MKSIFVAIASYRDPEWTWTVRDLFDKAIYPHRITVGTCWQYISPDDDHFVHTPTRQGQVRCIYYDARYSLGCCWAKAEAQKLWQREDYVLNIDSHMRFVLGWDEAMIAMLNNCPSPKPILSTYPAPYEPPGKFE